MSSLRCHYDVLGIPRNASDASIKSAYRSLALYWHPDKNSSPEAVDRFREVQSAWECLRTPTEKAWYDAHRTRILGENKDGMEREEEMDLYPYFSENCYVRMEGKEGFYSVYAGVFTRINAMEKSQRDVEKEEDCDDWMGPGFGDEQTPLEAVKSFYSWWSNFVTSRSFNFVEKWNLTDAPSRQHKRAMEKENKREREIARKEFNAEVRSLVEFIRRRDPRWKKVKEKLSEERERKKEELNRKLAAEAEARVEQLRKWQEEHETSEEEAEEVLEEVEIFECVACEKVFNTEKQLTNHEKTKKHLENVALLKETLLKEETELANDFKEKIEVSFPQEASTAVQKPKKTRKKKKVMDHFGLDDSEDEKKDLEVVPSVNVDESGSPPKQKAGKAKKAAREIATGEIKNATPSTTCQRCKVLFASRTLLFEHLRQFPKHAVIKK